MRKNIKKLFVRRAGRQAVKNIEREFGDYRLHFSEEKRAEKAELEYVWTTMHML